VLPSGESGFRCAPQSASTAMPPSHLKMTSIVHDFTLVLRGELKMGAKWENSHLAPVMLSGVDIAVRPVRKCCALECSCLPGGANLRAVR
jgi:hypothetical protein